MISVEQAVVFGCVLALMAITGYLSRLSLRLMREREQLQAELDMRRIETAILQSRLDTRRARS